jgi:hypothetical protein
MNVFIMTADRVIYLYRYFGLFFVPALNLKHIERGYLYLFFIIPVVGIFHSFLVQLMW